MKKIALLTVIVSLLFTVTAFAKTYDTTATYERQRGQTSEDAKHMCFLLAVREALEQHGLKIESKTLIKNFQVVNDTIKAEASNDDVSAKIISQSNDGKTYTCTVKTKIIDKDDFKNLDYWLFCAREIPVYISGRWDAALDSGNEYDIKNACKQIINYPNNYLFNPQLVGAAQKVLDDLQD